VAKVSLMLNSGNVQEKNKPISRGRKKRILADNHYGTGIFVHPLEQILCERDYKSIINPQGAEFFFFFL